MNRNESDIAETSSRRGPSSSFPMLKQVPMGTRKGIPRVAGGTTRRGPIREPNGLVSSCGAAERIEDFHRKGRMPKRAASLEKKKK